MEAYRDTVRRHKSLSFPNYCYVEIEDCTEPSSNRIYETALKVHFLFFYSKGKWSLWCSPCSRVRNYRVRTFLGRLLQSDRLSLKMYSSSSQNVFFTCLSLSPLTSRVPALNTALNSYFPICSASFHSPETFFPLPGDKSVLAMPHDWLGKQRGHRAGVWVMLRNQEDTRLIKHTVKACVLTRWWIALLCFPVLLLNIYFTLITFFSRASLQCAAIPLLLINCFLLLYL